MADKVEDSEKEDKNDKDRVIEREKAEKDDENERIKTEKQEQVGVAEKGPVNENSNDAKEQKDDKEEDLKTETVVKEQGRSEKDSKTEDKSKTVDLKLVQTHYKTHTKTTLPHILTEYGMEDKDHPKKEKKDKRRKKKKLEEKDETDDDDRRRRKAREEKFRQTFGDSRESDTYYIEYIDFLEKKVAEERLKAEKQREEEKRLAAMRLEEESEAEEEKKPTPPQTQRQRHRLQKRLQRVELKHDDAFMKELPRTDISRIIVLQDKMKREGKLKTQGEIDKFWSDIKKPDMFYAQFRVKPSDPGPLHPTRQYSEMNTNENSGMSNDPAMPPRSLSHISESSRGEKESWAITQKFQSSHGPKTPALQRKSSAQLAREAAAELEKRCPKLEMPPLACFSLQLGEKPPDPEEIQKKVELKMREKHRKKTQRTLNRMYQMAMTNTAAANRILAQHNDLTSMFEGAALRDVLSVFDDPTIMGHRREPIAPITAIESRQAEESILEAPPSSHASTRQSSAGSQRLTPISDTSSRASKSKYIKSKKPSLEAIEYPAPVPLSLGELSREKTIEPKCLSSFWTNYMHAGKSVFSTS